MMMMEDDTSYTSNLEEGFAVLPFRISILPDAKVSAVHLGDKNNYTICQFIMRFWAHLRNKNVDEKYNCYALVHCPHGVAHNMGELKGKYSAVVVEFFFCLNP